MRRVISFARRSSFLCLSGTSFFPRMESRSRTMGGPPSRSFRSALKCRAMEYVLHGGAAKMAA